MGFRLEGLAEARAELEAHAARARDLTPLLDELRAELEAMIDRAYAARRSPGGDRWPPLEGRSESDGELRRSVRVYVDGHSIVIDVRTPYASFQFFGSSRAPARNPLPFEPRGSGYEWMQRGEAGAWLDALPARIEAYLTGPGEERAA